jgi:hypothetical protein
MAELNFPFEIAVSDHIVTNEIRDTLETLQTPLVYRAANIDGKNQIVFSFGDESKAEMFAQRFDGRRVDAHRFE